MQIESIKSRKKIISGTFIAVIILVAASAWVTKFNFAEGIIGVPKAIIWMVINFYPNVASLEKLPVILIKLQETILLSIVATTTASLLALFFGLMGTKVTRQNKYFSTLSRLIASVCRNIPDTVWAMIFLIAFGQNVVTGYLALFFATFGILTRAFIETIDEASESVVEAIEAVGASYFQVVFQGILPCSMPQMISWILYMIETNIRSSTLVGILTGTGVGHLFDLYYKNFNYHQASLVVLMIIITIFAVEAISNYVRRVML